ncbi:tetratricopeptide repeat protein [Acidipila sp. EB88]|uniref:tetratricopeptide repeat protein n=1 Tax=Acidipila sp. EB88 TaxID=2305226 RepID=UPI000F6034DD|nr:tetratricopeptide repeat protein [Acidipila sp. EB88]RRA48606.1 tetratricopeptide repeat protein [Acidipila sp. EB88]
MIWPRKTRLAQAPRRQHTVGALLLLPLLFCAAHPLHAQDQRTQRAAALLQAGQFHDAELAWREITRLEPADASAHKALGIALAQQGRLAEASIEYRTSLKLRPQQSDASFNLGVAEFKQGHFAQAIPAFTSAALENPSDNRSGLLLGMSYFGLRQYAKAAGYLQTASLADPTNMELQGVLAQSCLWSRQYDCAMQQYRHMLTVNPDAVQAHMLLAEALDGMGKTEDAIAELDAAGRLAPTEPVLHFELGYLYYKKADYEKAVPEFKAEMTNNAGFAQTYAYLGDILFRTNDPDAAEPLLRKALALDDQLRLAYFDLGCISADRKNNAEAVAAFEHAVKLDPAQADAHYRLARIYMQQGDKQKASAEFARTKELHTRTDDSLIQKISGAGAPGSHEPEVR